MLVFKSFLKKYGSKIILDIPSFELEDGVYWLKAENGVGKSTLLKSMAGILPFGGSLLLDGKDLKKEKIFQRKRINYGEAEPLFPDFLTGQELINFFHSTKKGDIKISDKLIDDLHLKSALTNEISTYSSGMLKKLSLILAFIGEPKWILLDEPLITLDVEAVEVILATILFFHQKGVSFIITSHQSFSLESKKLPTLTIENQCLQLLT